MASTTDSQQAVDEVQRDMDEQRAERTEEYVGKGRRRLISQISRQAGQINELRSRLDKYEGQHPAPNGDEQISAHEERQSAHDDEQQNAQRQQPQQPGQQQPPPLSQQQADEQFRRNFQQAQQRLPQLAEEARQRIPDLEEALQRMDKENPVSAVAAMHISQLDNPFDTGVYLARNPGVIARLWALESGGHGDRMIAELNKIFAGLQFHDRGRQAATQPQRGRQSSAPAPIRPVGGGASRSTADPGSMDYQDFKRWREGGGGGGRR